MSTLTIIVTETRGRRGRDRMIVGFTTNYICKQ